MAEITMEDLLKWKPERGYLYDLPLVPELEIRIQRLMRVYKCSRERALEIAFISAVERDNAREKLLQLNEDLIALLEVKNREPKPRHGFWRYIFPKGE